MTDNGKDATLYANMAKVMGVLKTIPKNGRNKQQGYDFVTDSDLLDAIRPALAQNNIALVADMIEVAAGERPTKVLMRFRLCCGETGAVVGIAMVGSVQHAGRQGADGCGCSGAEVLPEGHVCDQHGRRKRRS